LSEYSTLPEEILRGPASDGLHLAVWPPLPLDKVRVRCRLSVRYVILWTLVICSDVNQDWTHKDKDKDYTCKDKDTDKDQTLKDQDKDKDLTYNELQGLTRTYR